MDQLSGDLRTLLLSSGATLVGFGDLSAVGEGALGYPVGISIAVAMDPDVLASISPGPSPAYMAAYHTLNSRLDALDELAATFLRERGFRAHAQTLANVTTGPDRRSVLPHKTVATRAGLGWIGKTALLVTEPYGPAVRISSVLTDAPLEVAQPLNESHCGSCRACVDACPAGAANGESWALGVDRNRFFDAGRCSAMISRRGEGFPSRNGACGLCVHACPYAQSYINLSHL